MTHNQDNITRGEILSFILQNELSELDRLHAIVENFGKVHDLQKKTIFEINLVLEEIFTNIVSYGHGDEKQHQVQFFLECDDKSIRALIEDDGVAFNLLEAEPVELNTGLDKRSVGGLGIHLIRNTMDEVTYKRVGAKNVVTLRKNLSK